MEIVLNYFDLLPIYDPPWEDTKQTIDRAIQLGVKVKMITGDQWAIAKETGWRLSSGDNIYQAKIVKDGLSLNSSYHDLDDLILHADASDTARSATDIVSTELDLSVVIEAILSARKILRCMRNYSVYVTPTTVNLLVGYSTLLFTFQFDFSSPTWICKCCWL